MKLGPKAFLFIPEPPSPAYRSPEEIYPLLKSFPPSRIVTGREGVPPGPWNMIVLDCRITDFRIFAGLPSGTLAVSLDEGSRKLRRLLPFLIDTLPLPPSFGPANVSSTAFLSLPAAEKMKSGEGGRGILVTFGGGDRERLGLRTVRWLSKTGMVPGMPVTWITGVFDGDGTRSGLRPGRTHLPDNVSRVPEIPDLKNRLADYGLVITKFGLPAYEAVQSGCSVLLVNPGPYHRRLSRLAGFPEAGTGRFRSLRGKRYLGQALGGYPGYRKRLENLKVRTPLSLAGFIESLSAGPRYYDCPVCGGTSNPAVRRLPDRTYFACSSCSAIYRQQFSGSQEEYGESYFFESYRRQYGKTYLDDFEHIRSMAVPRLETIGRLAGKTSGTLLDVGCAYGPFLEAARKAGFTPSGMDISPAAAAWVREKLSIPAAAGDFARDDEFVPAGFDVITMWYVIEHFERTGPVLSKVNRLLKKGGVFAFSTPTCLGVSGMQNPGLFFQNSPKDHVTVLSPSMARRILRRYGFRLKHVRITGLHPERFPGGGMRGTRVILLKLISVFFPYFVLRLRETPAANTPILKTGDGCETGAGLRKFLTGLFRLGDTFEAYAIKVSDLF
ncbi:MAG: class I SAM-dependent methyltransferase [Spirochaetales bacterium]|nr:MAG: class I SAM-dependent methyltransferase [Spirochaetales bacterium]